MASSKDAQSRKKDEPYIGSTQYNDPNSNPCIKEQALSLKCLNDYGGDKEACQAYFVNYKTCKKFWNTVAGERRRMGIKPYLPTPDERAEIKTKKLKEFSQK